MAEDLKQTLTKVLTSKGGKRFHFGYATGKTTDGKAEGFLMVGKKKFKKEQAEKECETKDFFAGFCWSDAEGKIVYFAAKGKKLSKMIVTKMILSVKHQTGRRYEFELPTEEEEAKADKLAEESESGDAENEEVPGAPPEPPAKDGAPAGLAAWQAARESVIKDLRAVAAKMAATKEPTAAPAIIELQSIIRQLTASPTTPQQVAELERYLQTDDVITAAEEIPGDFGTPRIREPLLKALTTLKKVIRAEDA